MSLKPTVPQINWNNPITKGLIFNLPFFEGGSTLTKDIISAKNATLSGDASWKKEIFGSTVGFAGSTGKLLVSNNSIFDVATGSVVLFFKTTQSGASIFLHQRANSSQSNGGFTLFLNSGTILAQIKTVGASIVSQPTSTKTFSDGNIHMCLLNFNQANGASNTIFVDGIQVATATNSSAWTWNTNNLTWGTGDDTFWTRLNGNIGPVSWYNRNLSTSEVKQLYTDPWQIYNRPIQNPIVNTITTVVSNVITGWRNLLGVGM